MKRKMPNLVINTNSKPYIFQLSYVIIFMQSATRSLRFVNFAHPVPKIYLICPSEIR